MLGGLGPCGRPICCGAFLGDFQPVSIKMAKEQNLSLNPTKISGVCGRLMCCLKYEQDNYEQTRKRMPKVGKEVITPDGNGVVWDINVIKETVKVRIQKGDTSELKDYALDEVQRPATVQQKETEKNAKSERKPKDENREKASEKAEKAAAASERAEEIEVKEQKSHLTPKQECVTHESKAEVSAEKVTHQPVENEPAATVSPWQQAVAAALKAAQKAQQASDINDDTEEEVFETDIEDEQVLREQDLLDG